MHWQGLRRGREQRRRQVGGGAPARAGAWRHRACWRRNGHRALRPPPRPQHPRRRQEQVETKLIKGAPSARK